ncbi:MAG TPA: 3-isopropylmalate dehydratase small subunit [Opitutales bacterium]|jgi:3-isopropylmalate/(R)-2-methylmalate dehydratase small subunit|nr:3-isopropylmalate dehydratase small subunit [Opitutales bacterium]
MALAKITSVSGRGVYVPGADIDTDRIIPARFMKCITFDGLGEFAFYDERKQADGSDKLHPLNDPRFKGASILLSGSNFGCGSSREHAPQSLYRYGFRAVIAESFAEIFFGNSITLGMPCLTMSGAEIKSLAEMIAQNPAAEITIDVAKKTVTCAGKTFTAAMPDSAHSALLSGKWDAIADLLEGLPDVARVAKSLAYVGA